MARYMYFIRMLLRLDSRLCVMGCVRCVYLNFHGWHGDGNVHMVYITYKYSVYTLYMYLYIMYIYIGTAVFPYGMARPGPCAFGRPPIVLAFWVLYLAGGAHRLRSSRPRQPMSNFIIADGYFQHPLPERHLYRALQMGLAFSNTENL